MTVVSASISLSTQGNTDICEITDPVANLVGESGLRMGIVTVFCPSSTSGVTTVEYESGCAADLRRMFDELVPADRPYQHDQTWGDANGFSHMRAALLKPSLTIPFVNGKLTLGTWQQIIYIDFDNRPRRRELVIQIMGE
jgi:secondary thiamine-phosphate synthase enzyme